MDSWKRFMVVLLFLAAAAANVFFCRSAGGGEPDSLAFAFRPRRFTSGNEWKILRARVRSPKASIKRGLVICWGKIGLKVTVYVIDNK
jgi:hypothetical protein